MISGQLYIHIQLVGFIIDLLNDTPDLGCRVVTMDI